MNSDLISREALREKVNAFYDSHFKGLVPNELITYAKAVDDLIDNAPTVEISDYQKRALELVDNLKDKGAINNRERGTLRRAILLKPARPQGEWITIHRQNSFRQNVVCFECNKCHKYLLPIRHTMITEPLEVCPNCGADLRNPNCVRCDHFGECDGCERSDEE